MPPYLSPHGLNLGGPAMMLATVPEWTEERGARGRLALRRAITARRICADGMLEAYGDRNAE
jgi:hypothetical protein